MKLFLCSHFSSVGSLIKEEIENKKVAFIPTASLREGYTGYGKPSWERQRIAAYRTGHQQPPRPAQQHQKEEPLERHRRKPCQKAQDIIGKTGQQKRHGKKDILFSFDHAAAVGDGDILAAQLPAGSITGAPKKKTCQIIDEAEMYERGFYRIGGRRRRMDASLSGVAVGIPPL